MSSTYSASPRAVLLHSSPTAPSEHVEATVSTTMARSRYTYEPSSLRLAVHTLARMTMLMYHPAVEEHGKV